jgi:hypothetical protein
VSWRRQVAIVSIVALLVVPTLAPEVLAFPYSTVSGSATVYSERPIDRAALDRVTARSAKLVAQSPLAQQTEPRTVFLTDGGWRWKWLALMRHSAFGTSRPGRETIVLNRSDVAADRVVNGRLVGGQRSLSGTLVHETCHGMLRRHFGVWVDWTKPKWLREGYCDHVAQESSLTKPEAARLKANGEAHPALPYFEGRQKVTAKLAENGGDVDGLFAAN